MARWGVMTPFLPLTRAEGGIMMTGVCSPVGYCTCSSSSLLTAVSLKDSRVNFRLEAEGLQAKVDYRDPASLTLSAVPSVAPTLPMHLVH